MGSDGKDEEDDVPAFEAPASPSTLVVPPDILSCDALFDEYFNPPADPPLAEESDWGIDGQVVEELDSEQRNREYDEFQARLRQEARDNVAAEERQRARLEEEAKERQAD